MKELLRSFLKFSLIFIILFSSFFAFVLIFKLFPILKITLNSDQLGPVIYSLSIPVFYHSLFNSLIISVFVFGVFVLNTTFKKRFFTFFIPVIISTLIILLILLMFNPTKNHLSFNRLEDARVFFNEKSFFENKGKKFYFESIDKYMVNNLIMVSDGKTTFHNSCKILFLEDIIIVNVPHSNGKIEKIEFDRDLVSNYISKGSMFSWSFSKSINNIAYKFIQSKSLGANVLFWFSIAFLILSFSSLISIKNYNFLSFIYNMLFIMAFYLFFIAIFDGYHKLFSDIFKSAFLRDIFISIVIIVIGIVFQTIKILFFRSSFMEKE